MRNELLPNDKDVQRENDLANMDAYSRTKLELSLLLKDLGKDVGRLIELRAAAPGGRDHTTIKVYSQNCTKLKEASELWKKMKEIVLKDEQKHKLDEKVLDDRKKMVVILGREIQDLSNRNAHVKQVKQTEEHTALQARNEERARKRRERGKKERKKQKEEKEGKGKKGKAADEDDGGIDVDIQDGDIRSMIPLTEQEQKFVQEVDEAKAEQDQMLDEIMKGMTDLKAIAIDMNTSIKTTAAMADEIGKAMDDTIDKFDSANKRLQDILEESGGLSRWCPMLICFIILIALVGYMFQMLK